MTALTALHRAAQCWCQPTTEHITMDVVLGLAIEQAIIAAEDAALERAAQVCECDVFRPTIAEQIRNLKSTVVVSKVEPSRRAVNDST